MEEKKEVGENEGGVSERGECRGNTGEREERWRVTERG